MCGTENISNELLSIVGKHAVGNVLRHYPDVQKDTHNMSTCCLFSRNPPHQLQAPVGSYDYEPISDFRLCVWLDYIHCKELERSCRREQLERSLMSRMASIFGTVHTLFDIAVDVTHQKGSIKQPSHRVVHSSSSAVSR